MGVAEDVPLLALLALEKRTTTPEPPCCARLLRARHAAHARKGYRCYIYDRHARGDRAGAGARGELVE